MNSATYSELRSRLELYFDRTALDAWARLTSDAPVSRIRATVRAGRERMRETLLAFLPPNVAGLRILDAGCGTGALAIELARRGALVVAVDLSPRLVELALERRPHDLRPGQVEFRVGDMSNLSLGEFDYVIAMDSLIHYPPREVVRVLVQLARQTRRGMFFTFAPKTPALTLMHAVGRMFPRGDRAPAIEPVSEGHLRARLAMEPALTQWSAERTARVSSGFYTSQALELART
jgi:magnesium-protoporphyrin O-methyltransferase